MNPPTRSKRRRISAIPWQAKLIVTIICIILLAGVTFYGLVRSYLHGDAFRRLLSEKASKAIGTKGEFGTFHWDGFALESASFKATGNGALRELQMDGLRTEIGLGGLKNGVWEIHGSKVHRLVSSFDFNQIPIGIPPVSTEVPSTAVLSSKYASISSWLPREVSFDALQIADATINAKFGDKQLTANNLRVEFKSFGRKGHAVDIVGGTIEIADKKFPPVSVNRIHLKNQDNRIFINQLQLSAWENARLDACGEIDRSIGRQSIDGGIIGVKCADILSGDWVKRLSGEIETTFSLNNHSGPAIASGKLVLKNGNLTAFPALDALATFSNTQRFRSLTFNDARGDWQWRDGRLSFENIVIASDGAIRAEGKITIDGENLDGQLNIGLPAEILAKLPSAAGDVFTVSERGMRWAPMNISGTTANPKEDLSGKLMGAAASRLIGNLQQGIPAATEIIDSEKPVEKGVEAILENSENASKLLKGLLRNLPMKE